MNVCAVDGMSNQSRCQAIMTSPSPALDAEPGATEAENLVLLAVVVEDPGPLFPETDDHRLLLVDDRGLVVIVPAIQTIHLDADGPVTDLVTTDGHEVLVGRIHPPVRRVLRVMVGQRRQSPARSASRLMVEPGVPELLDLGTRRSDMFSPLQLIVRRRGSTSRPVTSERRDSSGCSRGSQPRRRPHRNQRPRALRPGTAGDLGRHPCRRRLLMTCAACSGRGTAAELDHHLGEVIAIAVDRLSRARTRSHAG